MVSIETKSDFFASLRIQPQTAIFADWLWGLQISAPSSNNFSNANNAAHAAMYSIQANKKDIIEKAYQTLCLRMPNKDTPYIFNDILIFSFVCAVIKFGLDKRWLENVCNIRLNADDSEVRTITQSYLDILSDKQANLRGYCEIVIVYNYLFGNAVGKEQILNKTYSLLSSMTFPFYRSHFLNAIALRAMDLIVCEKRLDDVHKYEAAMAAQHSFNRQTNFVARATWFFILISVAVFSISVIVHAFQESNFEHFNRIVMIFSFLGISGGVGLLITKRKRIIVGLEKLIAFSWGYIITIVVGLVLLLILFKIGLWFLCLYLYTLISGIHR